MMEIYTEEKDKILFKGFLIQGDNHQHLYSKWELSSNHDKEFEHIFGLVSMVLPIKFTYLLKCELVHMETCCYVNLFKFYTFFSCSFVAVLLIIVTFSMILFLVWRCLD